MLCYPVLNRRRMIASPVLPEAAEQIGEEEADGYHEHAGLEHEPEPALAQLRVVDAARAGVRHADLVVARGHVHENVKNKPFSNNIQYNLKVIW